MPSCLIVPSDIIVGKVTADDALVQNPSENRPQIIKRTEFEYDWTGRARGAGGAFKK